MFTSKDDVINIIKSMINVYNNTNMEENFDKVYNLDIIKEFVDKDDNLTIYKKYIGSLCYIFLILLNDIFKTFFRIIPIIK